MADSVKDISQLTKIQLSPLPPLKSCTGFIRGILRGVRYAKSLRVLFSHRRSPSWTTLLLYSRVVFFFNEPTIGVPRCVRVLQTGQMYLWATVQDGVSGLEKQLQLFLLRKSKYGCSLSYVYWKNGCVYICTFVCLAQFSTKYICRAEYMRVISFPLWKYKTPRQWEGLLFYPQVGSYALSPLFCTG